MTQAAHLQGRREVAWIKAYVQALYEGRAVTRITPFKLTPRQGALPWQD